MKSRTEKQDLIVDQVMEDIGLELNLYADRMEKRRVWHEWGDRDNPEEYPSPHDPGIWFACGRAAVDEVGPRQARPITRICAECEARRPGMAERVAEANRRLVLVRTTLNTRQA